ncbi:coniferyl aldehyde dehydrogenase [Kangiella japonica]|uniref:Aldehyde dehydrogenase n=1 Tax=Kangiella japonica TaxID=647384 RepID=A0ABN0SXK9_9GAMM
MDLKSRLETFKQHYQREPYPSLEERDRRLRDLKRLLLENQDAIKDALNTDFGYRSPYETEFAEIYPALKSISFTRKSLSKWMAPSKRGVDIWFKPAKAKVMYQPLGVVGIIVPWNYPLFLALGPLIGALAAGNRVMLKMSEFTPSFSQLFAKLCEQYLGSMQVVVINGGADVGEAFSKLPFDHLVFTGSTNIGRKVMAAASENLTPVTLELGGKSPVIIDKKFPLKTAVERVLFGKLLNAGQTCLAPDYVFVHESQAKDFVRLSKDVARKFYPEWSGRDYTALASEKQVKRYQGMLKDAKEKGAKIIPLFEHEADQLVDNKAVPTLVLNTTPDMLIRQQEIFGPLLPVVSYQEHSEAIAWINHQPRPLALYLFSYNKKVTNHYMLNTISGGVTLNDTILHVSQDELPFGGVGASGMGHYHGREGFKTFSKAKSIYQQSRLSGVKLMYPPPSKFTKFLLSIMKR